MTWTHQGTDDFLGQ